MEPGDTVMCRTALGDEVFGTAVSGIVMGRDMQIVWVDFGDRTVMPWPVEAVREIAQRPAQHDGADHG
jgi:hypothetical protein